MNSEYFPLNIRITARLPVHILLISRTVVSLQTAAFARTADQESLYYPVCF
jgi:hypothetical protein